MAIKYTSLLVSLSDPINMLKNGFREYIESSIIKNIDRRFIDKFPIEHYRNYNHIPFIIKLIEDMFNGYTPDPDLDISPSTQILINDGMDEYTAKYLALNVFKSVIGIISAFVPDINFAEDGYRFDFCGEYDILIASPYIDSEKYDDEDEIKDWNNSFSVKNEI